MDRNWSEQNSAGSQNQPLVEYFRCPDPSVKFGTTNQSHKPRGYFRLGADVTCYGRLLCETASKSPLGDLHDALKCARADSHRIELPFDPQEVIEDIRRERYAAHFRDEGPFLNKIVRKTYYSLRPLMGTKVRRHLQKIYLRGWDKIPFPAWPVDVTVDQIHQKLLALALRGQGLEKVPFIWFWPEGYSSCAIMTHDVEGEEGKGYCGGVMDLDEAAGFQSAFQVVPEERYSVPKSFLDSITSRGFEVNVHDLKHDGRLYAEHAEFLRRAERINQFVRDFGAQGFRSGILYRNADWFEAFEFSYDMSLPNVAHLDPQRGGCCTVMPFFIGKIIELPVTCTQDYTLFQILRDYSLDLWIKQVDRIRKENGLISFIVHPDYIIEQKAQATYRALLDYLSSLRKTGTIWTALPRDVANWWRQRNQMKLVEIDGKWTVEGPGKERARVAFASLDGDTVKYSLAG